MLIPTQILLPDRIPLAPLPDRIPLAPLISWERVVANLQLKPLAVRRRIEHRFLLQQSEQPDRGVRQRFESVGNQLSWRIRHCLLAAAASGQLRTYVADAAVTGYGYEIVPDVWRGCYLVVDPVLLAATGLLAICADLVPSGARYAGSHIFLDKQEVAQAAELDRLVSEDEALSEAAEIVQWVVETAAAKRIRKAEFLQLLKQRCGRVSRKILDRAWRSSAVPAHWRDRGRWT